MAKQLLLDTIRKSTNSDEYIDDFLRLGKLQRLVLPEFKKFTEELIESNQDCDFILRPHIAENPEIWIECGKKFKNVETSLTGNISQILIDCDVLIHFNSTTSIEPTTLAKMYLLSYQKISLIKS